MSDASDLSDQLTRLFDHLNTTDENRKTDLPKWLSEFPYVNGGIFKDASPKMKFNSKARKVLIECAELNWKDINPDIFGSMIQAVVDPRQRGSLGMHYTSVENIMKVIDPLFLDDLKEELENNRYEGSDKTKNSDTRKKNNLNALLKRIAEIRIFDPACGSGNFLIIAYKEMSRLEMEVLAEINKFSYQSFGLSEANSRITLNQFYGIEIDDFAHEIAMLSLHLAKHQMNMEFLDTFGHANPTLPLKDTGQIKCGNALRVDWNEVCPREKEIETYILGNPPYLGSRYQKETHRNDMAYLLSSVKNYKKLDYISGWFFKGKKYIEGMNAKCAFVSTNSICQGEQVSILWKHLINKHIEIEFSNSIEIEFAHPSFKWVNNAKYNAGVTVIIIGIRNKSKEPKYLYNGDIKTPVENINSYLTTGQNIFLKKSGKSISNLPKIETGNRALDNGHYLLSCAERENLLKENPLAEKIIKPVVGAAEFLKGHKKYCLWIKDEDLEFANSIKSIKDKISKVKEYRTGKSIFGSINPVEKAHQFLRMKMAKKRLLFIPTVSSERRRYLPIGIFDNNTVIIDPNFAIYDPEIYIFGVISSRMHMQWMKTFTGRLETRLRYSSTLCYNTFPFPSIDGSQKKRIELAVDGVLKQRAKNYELTMAQLYDPDKMPEGLVEAHNNLDLEIEKCYRKQPFLDDAERLEYLFKMYEKMTGEK